MNLNLLTWVRNKGDPHHGGTRIILWGGRIMRRPHQALKRNFLPFKWIKYYFFIFWSINIDQKLYSGINLNQETSSQRLYYQNFDGCGLLLKWCGLLLKWWGYPKHGCGFPILVLYNDAVLHTKWCGLLIKDAVSSSNIKLSSVNQL